MEWIKSKHSEDWAEHSNRGDLHKDPHVSKEINIPVLSHLIAKLFPFVGTFDPLHSVNILTYKLPL
jgi:hypothetical protein